ncbi:NUDIX hydrolase [Shewanella gaetbuli]|uniref:Phosphatase NudJ n=1 Tax=Shewanella gaetbuli TaxID=220752 RepID=A0A9X2CM39_9GAMM|nr:NUDIX hydrolase [Shewanella gaetbuli]MCL1143285.1 NUDIX hydrolase [Shewanella gaetbuli]
MTERYKPNTTVAAVIHSCGKFLLVEELIDNKVVFNQPAGHLEARETLLQACQRELLEETGLVIIPSGLVGIYQFQAKEDLAFVRFTFCAELPVQVNAVPNDAAITRTHWFSRDEVAQRINQLRSPLVLQSIDDFIQQQGQHTPLSLINTQCF